MVAPGIGLPSALSVIEPVKELATSSATVLCLIAAFVNEAKLINSIEKQNSFNFIIIVV
jgi:hypothetical protein